MGCFSNCPQLRSVNCNLTPDQFSCKEEHLNIRKNGCGECPICFREIDACLQRGKSGQPVQKALVDEVKLAKILKKFDLPVTVQQVLGAEDGKIVNGCLILQEQYYSYDSDAFEKKTNFNAVIALRLQQVSSGMFRDAKNLETVVMLEACVIDNGHCYEDKKSKKIISDGAFT